MASVIVVFDACVLYPAPIRDLLMRLALADLFRAKWSKDIHREWIENILKNRSDLKREQLERTRELMDSFVRDALVEGYEKLIPALRLPDKNDRHVLAAAIRSSASIILTYNIKDFPLEITKIYGVEAQHPDDFLGQLLALSPTVFCSVVHSLRSGLKYPPVDVMAYLKTLERHSLPLTVKRLKEVIMFI